MVERPRDVDGLASYFRQHQAAGMLVTAAGLLAAAWWAVFVVAGGAGAFEPRLLWAGLAPCIFLVAAGLAWRWLVAPWLQSAAARRLTKPL